MKPSDQVDDLLYIIFLTPLNYSGQPPAFPLTILHIATYLNPCDLNFMSFDLHQILFCKARPPFSYARNKQEIFYQFLQKT